MSVIQSPAVPILDDPLASCLVGGILCGFALGLALTCGCSTGGLDVVGLCLTKRGSRFTVGRFSLGFNIVLYIACALLFDIQTAIYSVIYTVFCSLFIDRGHQQNINVQVLIFTRDADPELPRSIMSRLGRGVTYWEGKGAYTESDMRVLCVCVSKFEVAELRRPCVSSIPTPFSSYRRVCASAAIFSERSRKSFRFSREDALRSRASSFCLFNYFEKSSMFSKTFKDVLLRFSINRDSITSIFYYAAAVFFPGDTRHEKKVPQRINNHQTPMRCGGIFFMFDQYFEKFDLAPRGRRSTQKCKCIAYAETKAELEEMAYGPTHTSRYDVVYPIEGKGTVKEGGGRALQERLRRQLHGRLHAPPRPEQHGHRRRSALRQARALRTASAMSFRPSVRRRSTGSPRSRSSCCRFPPVRAATAIRA